MSQKIESGYSCTQSKTLPLVFFITTPGRKKLPISSKQSVLKIYFSPAERGETMEHFTHHMPYKNLYSYIFFPFLKRFTLLPCKTYKLLWYKLWSFRQNYLATMFFKDIQHVSETLQNVI